MIDIQEKWLTRLVDAKAGQDKQDAREAQKQAVIGKLAADRERQRLTISDGVDQEVVNAKGKKQRTLDYEKHDQTKEFDLDEQRDGFVLADAFGKAEEWNEETGEQAQFEKHLEAARIIDQMVLEMESQMSDEVDEDGNPIPLFSAEEIAAEVYDPLRRRGLIPETNIPDKYSRTQEMLDGTFAAYAKRLEKDRKGLGKRLFDENFGLAKTMVVSTVAIVGSGLTIEATGQADPNDVQTTWKPDDRGDAMRQNLGLDPKADGTFASATTIANQRMGFAQQSLGFVTDVAYEAGVEIAGAMDGGSGSSEVPDRIKLAAKLAQGLVSVAAMELGAPFNSNGMGMSVSSTFGCVANKAALTARFKQPAFVAADVAALAGLLGSSVEAALVKLDTGMNDALSQLQGAAGRIKAALPGGVDSAKVLAALEQGKFDPAIELFRVAVAAAVATGVTPQTLLVFAGEKAKAKAKSQASEVMSADFLGGEDEQVPVEVAKAHVSKTLGHEPDWVKDKSEKWVCATCQATNTKDPQIFAGIIERKIARLKRDQELMKWGSTLVGMGIDAAANFVAPLAIVGSAVKIAKNLFEAGKRTRDTINFVEKQQGMFNAASAYSAPVAQFIHNSSIQAANYYANAALEAAKMIGAIIQCTGAMAAPAGVVVTAAASIAQAIKDVLYEANKRYDLEVGWSEYKLALSRPENRKQGLIALKKNPTLAKYSMAWGAVIKEDPLVSDFMRVCDLGPEALKDPDRSVNLVVSYLETRLPDDNVVTGRTVDGPVASWAPAQVHLTAASWIATKGRGEAKGGLLPVDTRSFESALLDFEAAIGPWQAAAALQPAGLSAQDKQACLALIRRLDNTSTGYYPKNAEGGGPNVDMEDVKARFKTMIAQRQATAEKWPVAA